MDKYSHAPETATTSEARQDRFHFVVECLVRDFTDIRDRWRDDELNLFLDALPTTRLTAREYDRAFLQALRILAARMSGAEARRTT
jgi:hypothetical protein